jgi:hypothetical protein
MTDERIVLLWGVLADAPMACVHRVLETTGTPFLLLDQWKLADSHVELDPTALTGLIRFGDRTCDLNSIRSLYFRPNNYSDMPHIIRAGPDSDLWRHAAALEESLLIWADQTPAFVVNRPSSMIANSCKPYQSAWIASLGFRVPDTLVTTDPAAAFAFWEQHTEVIYKSVSGTRSIVSRLRPEHRPRVEQLGACPTQFQQYIPGTEYRAHVVGSRVFACRIISAADDYRYSTDPVDVAQADLPDSIAELCIATAAAMDLPVAGIDLRLTPDGDWYCLEVNPSPGFSYYDVNRSPSIAEAVAALLAQAEELVEIELELHSSPPPAQLVIPPI